MYQFYQNLSLTLFVLKHCCTVHLQWIIVDLWLLVLIHRVYWVCVRLEWKENLIISTYCYFNESQCGTVLGFSYLCTSKLSMSTNEFSFLLLQVSKAYSKTWSFKEDALLEVMKIMSELERGSDEAKNMMRAAVFLINKGLKDKVFAVSSNQFNILKYFVSRFDCYTNIKLSIWIVLIQCNICVDTAEYALGHTCKTYICHSKRV